MNGYPSPGANYRPAGIGYPPAGNGYQPPGNRHPPPGNGYPRAPNSNPLPRNSYTLPGNGYPRPWNYQTPGHHVSTANNYVAPNYPPGTLQPVNHPASPPPIVTPAPPLTTILPYSPLSSNNAAISPPVSAQPITAVIPHSSPPIGQAAFAPAFPPRAGSLPPMNHTVTSPPRSNMSLQPSAYYPVNNPQSSNQIQAASGASNSPSLTELAMLVWRDDPLLHFGVLFQNASTAPGGIMLDITRHDVTRPWEYRFPVFLEFANPRSLRFLYEDHDSPRFLRSFHLGYIDDRNLMRLQQIAERTPLPSGPFENCQTWVLTVIKQACNEGILYQDVYHRAAAVPRYENILWSPGNLGVLP